MQDPPQNLAHAAPEGRRAAPAAAIPTDAQLMAQLAAGHLPALGQLVARHQDRVRALAFRILLRHDAADDVCQDTFLRVYHSASRYKPDAAFTTWLYRIVVNLCLDRAKRPRLASLPDDAPGRAVASPSDHPLLDAEKADAVRQAVAALPERQRIAVILHRYEGLTQTQVAAATGWSESAVESLLSRAYASLRQNLRPWLDS